MIILICVKYPFIILKSVCSHIGLATLILARTIMVSFSVSSQLYMVVESSSDSSIKITKQYDFSGGL